MTPLYTDEDVNVLIKSLLKANAFTVFRVPYCVMIIAVISFRTSFREDMVA